MLKTHRGVRVMADSQSDNIYVPIDGGRTKCEVCQVPGAPSNDRIF